MSVAIELEYPLDTSDSFKKSTGEYVIFELDIVEFEYMHWPTGAGGTSELLTDPSVVIWPIHIHKVNTTPITVPPNTPCVNNIF